jgi:hypothetical protein
VLLTVAFYVERRDMQEIWVVAEETEPVVAPLTQQPANHAGRMVVVQVLRFGVPADGAQVALRCSHLSDVILCEFVSTIKVGGTALGVLAGLAATPEARRRCRASRVILVSHGLLAGRAPTESVGDPRVVTNNFALATPMLAIPAIIARAIARKAVEGEAVRLRLVTSKCGMRKSLSTLRAPLHMNPE